MARPANANSIAYQPGQPPDDPQQMPRYIRELEARIAATVTALAAGHLDRVYVMPPKPRDGDVRYLDGSIAPGGVRGTYLYDSTAAAWKFLG